MIDDITSNYILATVANIIYNTSTPTGYDGTLGSMITVALPDVLPSERRAEIVGTIIDLVNNGTGKFTAGTVLQDPGDFDNSFFRIETELTNEQLAEYELDEDFNDHDDWDAPEVIVLGI